MQKKHPLEGIITDGLDTSAPNTNTTPQDQVSKRVNTAHPPLTEKSKAWEKPPKQTGRNAPNLK